MDLEMMYNYYEFNIKIDNSFFEDWLEDKNKIDELYVLYCLHRLTQDIHKNIVLTNIHLLSMTAQIQKVANKNFACVSEALIGLARKGFIHIRVLDTSIANKFMQPMKIYLLRTNPQRYTVIEHWMFERSLNAKEFFVFAYIAKWKNSDHKVSINEWALQMGYQPQGIEKLLKKMQSEGRINIESGKYYHHEKLNRYLQEVNDYSVVYKDDDVISTVEGEITILEIRERIEYSSWGRRVEDGESEYAEIEQDDYNLYRICSDYYLYPKFIAKCKSVISKKSELVNYDGMFERYETEYMRLKETL